MMINNSRKLYQVVVLIIIYRLLLDYSYFEYVVSRYTNYGFSDSRSEESFYLSWILVFVSFAFFILHDKFDFCNPSTIVLYFLYLFSFIPFTVCVYAGIISSGCLFLYIVYTFILFLLHFFYCKYLTKNKSDVYRYSDHSMRTLILFMIAFVFVFCVGYVSYYYTNFRIFYNLLDVYGIRREARGYDIPSVIRYGLSMSAFFFPIVCAYCIIQRRKLVAGMIAFVQFLNFSIAGQKFIIFSLGVAFLIIVLHRKYTASQLCFLNLIALIVVNIIGIIELSLTSDSMIYSFLNQRVLFLPSFLHEVYYQFFSSYSPDYFSSSFLRHFGCSSEFDDYGGIPMAIGAFMGFPQMNANNGILSDAVANLGEIGAIIMPFAVMSVLYWVDKCAADVDGGLIMVVAFLLSIYLISGSIGTIMLSNGGVIVLLSLSLMNHSERKKDNSVF